MGKIPILVFALALIVLLTGTAGAEEIDSVILASEGNYPDALAAGSAAERIGAPLLLTESGNLPQETLDEIGELNVSRVYIIGGPYAVSEVVEDGLDDAYEVVRIWGMTRFGTSAAVAEYFWEESSRAVLVWDALGLPSAGNSEVIAKARDLAQAQDAPLLLIPKNVLPEAVSDALVNLSVEEVTLIGDTGSQVDDDLAEMGIIVAERITGNLTGIKEKIRERVRTLLGNKRPLVVIAVGNWSDLVNAPYMPNGTSRHISGEDQIDTLIDEINQENYTRIKIVGKPALAKTIYDRLTDAGISSTLISGRPVKVARDIMKLERAVIRLRVRLHALSRNTAALAVRASNLNARAAALVDSINATVRRLEQAMVRLNTSAILEKARLLRERIRSQVSSGSYDSALATYKILESYQEQLRLRNIAVLRKEITSAISSEKVRSALIRKAAGS